MQQERHQVVNLITAALASRRAVLHNVLQGCIQIQAALGSAHCQTALRCSGRSEDSETQARDRVYTREREHMTARTHTGASALACARSSTVSTMVDECNG